MTTTTSFESVTKNSLNDMNIRVYNTLTRNKEPFQTVETGKVGRYLCGPTV